MFRGLNYIILNIIKHSKETLSKTTILNWIDYILPFIPIIKHISKNI